jgi:RHS repeat-associated protein
MTLVKEGASSRATYCLDDAGMLTKMPLGNGSYTEYLYNGAGSLTLLSNRKSDATVISAFAYGVDDTGNRTKMSISGSAYTSADVAYAYDDAHQLTGEVRTGGNAYAQYFWYDANGNRTKSTLEGTDTTYLYSTGDQLTGETTGGVTTTYLYDANGALTKSDDGTTVNAYSYDYDGYQTAFDTTGTDSDATYLYDADKRRIGKTVDSTTTKYFLDGADVIADCDGSNSLVATYVTPGLDNNVSHARSGSTYYYMKDGLGSVRNVVDSSEATQNTYDYYAFGKELGTWTQGVTNKHAYTAREYDLEAKQYYYRARYYSGDGAFAARDKLLPQEAISTYAYVLSNPISLVDPYGLEFTPKTNPIGYWNAPEEHRDGTKSWGRLKDMGSGKIRAPIIKSREITKGDNRGCWECWVAKAGVYEHTYGYYVVRAGKTGYIGKSYKTDQKGKRYRLWHYKQYVQPEFINTVKAHEMGHIAIYEDYFNKTVGAAETKSRELRGKVFIGSTKDLCEFTVNNQLGWDMAVSSWQSRDSNWYIMLANQAHQKDMPAPDDKYDKEEGNYFYDVYYAKKTGD